jgi:chaperonin GroEL
MSERSIVHAWAARAALLRGVDLMTGLLRPTLGPVARTVAIAPIVGNGPPEVLDSAATIARRTVQLADPFADMGGMIVRHLVWRVFETAGDGTATAAVLARGILRDATAYVTAGGSPVPIRRGIERGLAVALEELQRQARPIETPAELAAVAAGILRDPELAGMVGEVVESTGPEGAVLIEEAQGAETGYQYVDGVQWDGGYVSHFLLQDGQTTVRLLEPRVFVTDYALEKAEQLLPALEACVAAGARSLLVVAPEVRDSAVGLLVLNRERGLLDGAVAVRAPSIGDQQTRILEDLAVVTGGRCVRRACGERLEDVTVADLGQARQAWASKSAFGILGGRGDRAAIRQRIAEARRAGRDLRRPARPRQGPRADWQAGRHGRRDPSRGADGRRPRSPEAAH